MHIGRIPRNVTNEKQYTKKNQKVKTMCETENVAPLEILHYLPLVDLHQLAFSIVNLKEFRFYLVYNKELNTNSTQIYITNFLCLF